MPAPYGRTRWAAICSGGKGEKGGGKGEKGWGKGVGEKGGKGVSLNCAISPEGEKGKRKGKRGKRGQPELRDFSLASSPYSPNNASCLASAAAARSLRGRPRTQ